MAMTVENLSQRLLSQCLGEGDYSFGDTEQEVGEIDNLALARDPSRTRSPQQLVQGLVEGGYLRLDGQLSDSADQVQSFPLQTELSVNLFPAWHPADQARFTEAKEAMERDDPSVVACLGELVHPDDPLQSKRIMFIAAGGLQEGLVTARGVWQMRKAMEQAQQMGIPIVYLNAVTSADPSFKSEVGQISRQISETMALGLRLTVPKVTVVTGEAASAGAHAAWQIADRTLILDKGALLTVIKPEEALNLLHFGPEITAEANRRFLDSLGLSSENGQVSVLMQGIHIIQNILTEKEENRAQMELENEDNLKAALCLTKEVAPKSRGKVMLIMPADNSRYVSGMLTRGADMITIQADNWQRRTEAGQDLTKPDFIAQVKEAMREARQRETKKETEIYFRLNTADFSGFWTIDDVRTILRELHGVGLTGIRLTDTASSSELQQLTAVMRETEEDLRLPRGTFRICLSVENDEAIGNLREVVEEGNTDKRVSTVVMGVRDYTKSKAYEGVKERDWSHPLVVEAKQRLASQVAQLRENGWERLQVFHAVASIHNDYASIHREANAAKALGADGMLAVAPEQISHIRASFEDLFDPDGHINRDRLTEILQAAKIRIGQLLPSREIDQLIYVYHRLLYQTYHQYRVALLKAGKAFPEGLQEMGIVDEIIQQRESSREEALVRSLWQALESIGSLDQTDIRRERLLKLARIGKRAVRKTESVAVAIRKEKAKGRGQKATQFWLDLLTQGNGFTEEILTDLEPDTATDVLARIGRTGARTYLGQVGEAQEVTGTLSGIIAGYTQIGGRDVLLIIRDQDYINATAGAATGEIVRRACLDAVRRKKAGQAPNVAICYLDVSAGGRVQEGALALAPSELAVAGLVEAREVGIPVVNVGHTYILGSDGIGPFYCADRIVLVGEKTELGLAGRRIVERTSPRGKEEFPPGFRLAAYHKAVGNIDEVLAQPSDLLDYLGETLPAL